MHLFACPLPYDGRARIAQLNAYMSWVRLFPVFPGPPIALVGNEDGTRECCAAFGFIWGGEVERDPFGTPLVSDVFAKGEAACTGDVVAYVNADIILMNDFIGAVATAANRFTGPFLMVGRRTDLNVPRLIAFTDGWRSRLRSDAQAHGVLHQAAGVDYFVYRRGTLGEMPTFALGRLRWDNWIVWDVLNRGIPVIDATEVVLAIHQNHDFSHRADHGERQQMANDFLVRFSGGRLCTINDATHKLTKTGVIAR